MGKIIGIDLGTTNSLVAIVESGIPLVLADGQGRRLTPSVVRVSAAGEPVVGWEAKRGRVAHPETTVTSIKRFMGRRGDEVDSTAAASAYAIRAEGSGPVAVPLHGRDWSPEELSAEILKRSEEHTSELQSRRKLVWRLRLEKKKKEKEEK